MLAFQRNNFQGSDKMRLLCLFSKKVIILPLVITERILFYIIFLEFFNLLYMITYHTAVKSYQIQVNLTS